MRARPLTRPPRSSAGANRTPVVSEDFREGIAPFHSPRFLFLKGLASCLGEGGGRCQEEEVEKKDGRRGSLAVSCLCNKALEFSLRRV